MAETKSISIRIVEFPEERALLEHSFNPDRPARAAIRFEPAPAHLMLANAPGGALQANIAMSIGASGALPVCIKLCEPICADSDYVVTLTLFDRPIISISIKGRTRLYNCHDKEL